MLCKGGMCFSVQEFPIKPSIPHRIDYLFDYHFTLTSLHTHHLPVNNDEEIMMTCTSRYLCTNIKTYLTQEFPARKFLVAFSILVKLSENN